MQFHACRKQSHPHQGARESTNRGETVISSQPESTKRNLLKDNNVPSQKLPLKYQLALSARLMQSLDNPQNSVHWTHNTRSQYWVQILVTNWLNYKLIWQLIVDKTWKQKRPPSMEYLVVIAAVSIQLSPPIATAMNPQTFCHERDQT